ncbi:MAG: hypothetical protein ABSC21_12520 [Terriglobia bacterium]|jgi:hypothetical protein
MVVEYVFACSGVVITNLIIPTIMSLAGAGRCSAPQDAILALFMPAHKGHFAPGDPQSLTNSSYRRGRLFESK